jgi:hypothetical protein
MIALYALALIVSVGIYAIARPLGRTTRFVLGVTSFILFSAVITIWIGTLRDEPVDGARTVTPEEVANPRTTTAPSNN